MEAYQENFDNYPLNAFFALSSEIMCVLDNNGLLQAVNPAVKNVLGYQPSALNNTDFATYIHSDDVHSVQLSLSQTYQTEKPSTFVCRCRCADKTYKWLLWRLYLGSNNFLMGIAKDITPYQQLENAETARHNFSEALLDTMLAINSSLSLEQVLTRILSNIGKVVAHDHVNIMLVEEGRAYIADYQAAVSDNRFDAIADTLRLPIAENYYLHQMLQLNTPVIVYDIENDARWQGIPQIPISGSYLGCPISVKDEVIGFLNVVKLRKNFYTTIHARQLLTFANQAGIAIKNAALYEQSKFAAVLEERQRLARELHDSVNQSLFAAHAIATLLPKVLDKKPEKLAEYTDKISQRISGALDQMRLVLIELYPNAIIETELDVLLKHLCAAFTENTGLSVDLTTTSHVLLDKDSQLAYYRIAQEALHNIEKYADASHVIIRLEHIQNRIRLGVEDNGVGFDLTNIPTSHFGIKNMMARAQNINANLQIDSKPGKGTSIVVEKILS